MSLPRNNKETKSNKLFDYNNEKLLYLIELLRDHLAVNLYIYSSNKGISNEIVNQIETKCSFINIKCSLLQNNKAIMLLIHTLLEEEVEKSLRYALEITFACDLSSKKIIIEHDYCHSAFW